MSRDQFSTVQFSCSVVSDILGTRDVAKYPIMDRTVSHHQELLADNSVKTEKLFHSMCLTYHDYAYNNSSFFIHMI